MCWCNPRIRTPQCTKPGCVPPGAPAAADRAADPLFKLVADLRWALGDHGLRMHPDLVRYASQIKTERDTALHVLRQIASGTRRTREQRLAKSCVGLIDSLRNGGTCDSQPNDSNQPT